MAHVSGRLTTCDRCGAEIFSKSTGKEPIGFSVDNCYEPLPTGWKDHIGVGMLCPKCNAEYKHIIKVFMRNTQEIDEQKE